MQALSAVKSPAEFLELQQKLIKEGVEAAVNDSRHIAQLTTAVFTAARAFGRLGLVGVHPGSGQHVGSGK